MENVPMPPLPPQPEPRRDYLAELQALDEPMKRRVLVAASAVMMAIVVYVWIGYFNSIVMGGSVQLADQSAMAQSGAAGAAVPAGASAQNTQDASTNPPSSAPDFWQMLRSGLVSLYHGAVSGFKGAGSALQAPKQYDITPSAQPAQVTQ